ncbi:methionine aminopeptidase 1D, mitochondrial [Macrosteles quadrilineatus]|uniref:methionine aminopeptidase 1D, mitochondrial n=1 Tax=Macrosteles quadrilineatus TaxID=74068 RepID=UPI0023E10E6C|nr:methionine aminopeptidase 1D, mitochondrial [Macrosteles quadrilineatus]
MPSKTNKPSQLKEIPKNVVTPKYYKTAQPTMGPSTPEIKSTEQINGMRQSCRLAREILDSIHSIIKVGMTTDELDDYVHNLTVSRGAYPSPLNYKGFPKSICTSVNNVVCHGIPDHRPLHDGDIVNVDITVFFKGYHGDCSAMFYVGNVDEKGKQLSRVTLESLNEAIKVCGPGRPISDIGNTVDRIARKNRMRVVAEYIGHGIGTYFHGYPEVLHYANNEKGLMLPGMTFTIEPILAQGSGRMTVLSDGWTSVTMDGSRAAQWEHTVLITRSGVEVLTGPDHVLPEG